MQIMKLYQRGIITEGERYNQVLDAWTHAREQITTEMMEELENDIGGPLRDGRRLREPDLPDGPLRRPRRRRADSPVGRHARFDGQAVGQDHRNADQGEFPRGPDRAGVLQFHARCPQGSGRYGLEDGRLGLPDPQAGRRGPERRGHHARLRHHPGHHQGRDLSRRKGRSQPGRLDQGPRQPHEHRQPHHRRGDRPRERPDHHGRRAARSRPWAWRRSRSAAR